MKIIMRKKSGGAISVIHYGLMVNDSVIYDMEPDNEHKGSKTLEEFADGENVYLCEILGDYSTSIKRLINKVNKEDTYDVLTNNCEHFVNEVKTGEKSSKQVWIGLITLSLTGYLGYNIYKETKNPYLTFAVLFGMIFIIMEVSGKLKLNEGELIYRP